MEWLLNGAGWFVEYFFPEGFSPWHVVGIMGTLLFGSRFIVQWVVSEIKGESVIPMAFWYLSIAGSLLLLFYVLFFKQDLILTIGYLPNCLIYTRNLYLVHMKKVDDMVKVETPTMDQADEAPPRDTP